MASITTLVIVCLVSLEALVKLISMTVEMIPVYMAFAQTW